ncbi:ATP-binding protein [Lentzea sp.]|uniref:ATP-binding protein n=1 Tax=Lentzea sp. TaxID=56099 RepID=UPI002C49C47B|nr:tetratricopeptide repeat protein [Lentzea sp.]HUQ55084.1 tetratricopeptide repeat protein [Lentzea sp.]
MNTNDLGENRGNAVQAGYVGHLVVGSAPDHPPVPRQLPFASPGFVGRTEHLAALDLLLTDTASTALAAVVGTAGVGKSALVVRWAREAQRHFPGGTLFADLHGYGPGRPAAPGEVLADFLTALGIAPERVPPHLEARASLYRSLLVDRRVLVILDNATNAEQVRPLLPGGPGCVVVTSRSALTGLEIREGARRVALPLLTGEEAADLVRTVLGSRPAEPAAVTALVDACARLPLALRIAAGRIAANPHLTVAALVAELRSERLEALSVPDDARNAVRPVFDWSYRRLPPEQARMFRRIGLLPSVTVGVHVGAVLCDATPSGARGLLSALAAQHLLDPVGKDRYTCHDLLRAYAADLADQDDDRDQTVHRLLEWVAHHARKAFVLLFPDRADMHMGARVATSTGLEIDLGTVEEVWAWVAAEFENAVGFVRMAACHDLPGITMLLAGIASGQLSLVGRFDEALEVCRLGVLAAEAAGDPRAVCLAGQALSQLHCASGDWRQAIDTLQANVELAREIDDPVLCAEALSHLGWVHLELGRYADALPFLDRALALGPDGTRMRGFTEFCLSGVHAGLGDHEQALLHAECCLALLDVTDHFRSYAWHAMARARQVAGAHAEAVEMCERALGHEVPQDNPRNHALLLDTLGESLRQLGARDRALACWREALLVLEERGDHRAPELRERLAALVSASAG